MYSQLESIRISIITEHYNTILTVPVFVNGWVVGFRHFCQKPPRGVHRPRPSLKRILHSRPRPNRAKLNFIRLPICMAFTINKLEMVRKTYHILRYRYDRCFDRVIGGSPARARVRDEKPNIQF